MAVCEATARHEIALKEEVTKTSWVVLPNGVSLKENLPFRERPIISGRLEGVLELKLL